MKRLMEIKHPSISFCLTLLRHHPENSHDHPLPSARHLLFLFPSLKQHL